MKYEFHLLIEKNKEKLLEVHGSSIARSEIGILKGVRRSINSAIKNDIDHIEGKEAN